MFNVGSLSKPVFAYGVLKLVDAGKLKLDEPLAPYLPKEFTAGDPRFNQITARIVLSHRTGFPNWPGDGQPLAIHFTPGETLQLFRRRHGFSAESRGENHGQATQRLHAGGRLRPAATKHSSYVWNPAFENDVAIGHDVHVCQRPSWIRYSINLHFFFQYRFSGSATKANGAQFAATRSMHTLGQQSCPDCLSAGQTSGGVRTDQMILFHQRR